MTTVEYEKLYNTYDIMIIKIITRQSTVSQCCITFSTEIILLSGVIVYEIVYYNILFILIINILSTE